MEGCRLFYRMNIYRNIIFVCLILSYGCKKENIIPGNNAAYYGEIPTLLLEN